MNTKQKESAKPSRNMHSGKPELRHHQQSFLPQISLVLSATGSLELRLVSSAILEHTNNNTTHSWLGLVFVSNDRWTYYVFKTLLDEWHSIDPGWFHMLRTRQMDKWKMWRNIRKCDFKHYLYWLMSKLKVDKTMFERKCMIVTMMMMIMIWCFTSLSTLFKS